MSGIAAAQEFQVVKSTSVTAAPIQDLKPKTIAFNDHKDDEGGGFIKFEDWSRVSAAQKQFLSLYPSFAEATVTRNIDGAMKTYKDKLQIAKMNVDENREIPAKFGIRGIPTLMLFKDGQLAATKVGALNKAQLSAFLDQHLA